MSETAAGDLPRDRPRCSVLSEAADEPLPGTAATDRRWLFVEVPGAWGRKAVTGSGLPEAVVAHLGSYDGRVQLIRRPGPADRADRAGRAGRDASGVRVLAAEVGPTVTVRSTLVDRLEDVPDLADADLAPHDEPLWLVCTNGRRDLCCAERGRPVALALAGRRPEQVWETSHLGGHRYAATALHLPSGLVLGRLDPAAALAALGEVEAGRVPVPLSRGRAGLPPAAQAAELGLRERHGWTGLAEVVAGEEAGTGDEVVVDCATPDGPIRVTVRRRTGPPGLASCADDQDKATVVHEVVTVATA